MKFFYRSVVFVASLSGMFMFTACDWESGSQDNFNESQVTGTTNVSGFFEGQLSGQRAVSRTSGSTITHFTVQQSGKNITVTDNRGIVYKGTLGDAFTDESNRNPNDEAVTSRITTTISAGFEGFDSSAGKNIRFNGVFIIEEAIFQNLQPDGDGGFVDIPFAGRNSVMRGSWIEANGLNGEVLAQAEASL